MPYPLIALFASAFLGLVYVAATEATPRSKVVVAVAILASFVVWHGYPRWLVAATLLQVATSVYVLLYLKVHASGG